MFEMPHQFHVGGVARVWDIEVQPTPNGGALVFRALLGQDILDGGKMLLLPLLKSVGDGQTICIQSGDCIHCFLF